MVFVNSFCAANKTLEAKQIIKWAVDTGFDGRKMIVLSDVALEVANEILDEAKIFGRSKIRGLYLAHGDKDQVVLVEATNGPNPRYYVILFYFIDCKGHGTFKIHVYFFVLINVHVITKYISCYKWSFMSVDCVYIRGMVCVKGKHERVFEGVLVTDILRR